MRGKNPATAPLRRLTLVALMFTAACVRGEAQDAPAAGAAAPVRTAPVERVVMARPILATGTVAPRDEITLSFKVGGVIAGIVVDEGDRVTPGSTLASLDLREIDAVLARARSAADKARRDLARARRLFADSVVALAQLQDAETAAEVAEADLQAAEFNRRYAEIVAPAAGTILRRTAEPGETVWAGAPVLVLGSRARGVVVRAGLADRDIVRVARGDPAVARFDALPDRAFAGTVAEIGAAAEPGIGTWPIEVALEEGDALVAGMVGTLEITPASGDVIARIPVEAVLEANDGVATVFVLSPEGGRAVRRRVRVAFIDGGRVAVTEGLEGVAAVVTQGAAWLDDGAAVEVVR